MIATYRITHAVAVPAVIRVRRVRRAVGGGIHGRGERRR